MRCLILIALCFALANASYFNKNRFQNLLNRNQWGQNENQWGQENLFGSDDTDDYIEDYVEQIRRERMFGRDQCPRGLENILGQDEEEYGNYDVQDLFRGQYPTGDMEDMIRTRQHPTEDMEDMIGGRQHWSEDSEGLGRQCFGDEDCSTRSPLLKEVRDANVKLATRLYEQCKNEKDDKNTVVSPLSVQLALASLNWGARGNTRRQIGHVIGGNLKTQERKQIFTTLVRHLKGLRNMDYTGQHSTKINTVTGIFVSQRTPTQQHFIQQVKSTLGANVRKCSFSQQPQQCRQMINQFVSQKTHNKINHIVPQDAITDNTKMVLVNALELKATWGQQMRRHVTKQAKFYPLDTKKVKVVEVMETEGRFKYFEDELVKIVGLPTKQRELTLYTIVPKDKDGLTDVEKVHLQDSVQLKQLLQKTDMHTRRVHVQLPKFQIKHKVDVRRTLRKQGVTDAFDSKRADFSGITGINKYQQDEMEETSFRRNPFVDIDSESGMWGQQRHLRSNPFEDNQREGDMWGQGTMGQRETKLHLNKFIHQCTIKITENGITATTGSQTEESYEQYGHGRMSQGRLGGMDSEGLDMFDETSGFGIRDSSSQNVVKANRAFAFVLKHNPTNQLVMVGRVIDAAQKKVNNVPQTINDVDQL